MDTDPKVQSLNSKWLDTKFPFTQGTQSKHLIGYKQVYKKQGGTVDLLTV